MRIQLLVVPDCANEAAAVAALHEAAGQAGLEGIEVDVTVVHSDEEARRLGFVGSPTFVIDGTDPFAVPGASPGLACRIYRTEAGPSGVPQVSELRDALLRALT